MLSKLDPHIATIEDWLAAQPQLTALTIVGRLSEKCPEQFRTRAFDRAASTEGTSEDEMTVMPPWRLSSASPPGDPDTPPPLAPVHIW